MDNLIKNLYGKLIKKELANKSLQRQKFAAANQGFYAQYRKSPLHIMKMERKEQQYHIHPPLYIEHELEELIWYKSDVHGSLYSSFFDEGQEVKTYEEEEQDLDATLNDDEIDDYYKQFIDFMQDQLHKKREMRSYRKRSRGKYQKEGTSSIEPHKPVDKGKGFVDPIIPRKKDSSYPNYYNP